jgi:hypothetical protein
MTPPVRAVGFIVRILEWSLIGWWYEKRVRVRIQAELLKEVGEQFWFLFSERNARIVPNANLGHLESLVSSGWPVVTLATDEFLLRSFRWLDNYRVHVAPARLPSEWHELSAVLNAMEPDKVGRHSIVFLLDAARLLRQYLDVLEQAFSEQRYPKLKEQLEEFDRYDRVVTKQVETEINRSLYGLGR